ncbi:hypothetical protein [Chitinilyticum aquatile]|uniref:hypothetical protein n=1 Tax=Chitinilyticum aquatile TaxID=362520 RepID=UPI000425C13C|nr:hypothetical protein [Chitinilyticum aquatile]
MAAYGFFDDVILPACVVTAFAGFFLLLAISRILYDYIERNYGLMLNKTLSSTFWVDQDMAMAYVGDIWALTRSGEYRRIESPFWRGLFAVNAAIGLATSTALVVLILGFLGLFQ